VKLEIGDKLFKDWDLSTWADVLGIFGFVFAFLAFAIGLFIKSQIKALKTQYIFDKRISKHIRNLGESASLLNRYLDDYNHNHYEIQTEFGLCIKELQDLLTKISFNQGLKSRQLVFFMKMSRARPFVKKGKGTTTFISYLLKYVRRLYQTTYDDVYVIYSGLLEIIRQLENIKENKAKSL